ncbi:MAG: ABC transporter permease, partial [Stutzerimonas stutzeri]
MSIRRRIEVGSITGWLLPAIILAGWEAASRIGLISGNVLPAPSAVAEAFWRLLLSGELIANIGVSSARALAGFAIGGSIGFIFGLANGLSKFSRSFTDTTLQMIRNIPHLALIPLVILWFGIDE